MKLTQFKLGDIILKEHGLVKDNMLFGPVEFLAYEHGLLFCNYVQMPDTYLNDAQFLQGIKAVQIGSKKIAVFKMDILDDDWFEFPIKTLNKIKAYIAIKYPEKAELIQEETEGETEEIPLADETPAPVHQKEKVIGPQPPSPFGDIGASRGAGFIEK